jgi:enoyl-CoA hydratase/carnithine racemase
MLEELADIVEHAEARCLVIRGDAEGFSAGYDLRGVSGPDFPERARELVAHPHHRAFRALEQSPVPVIAQLTGYVLGGGLELAICCDLRFASADAVFAMPAGRIGLTYSHTGLRRFVETVGLAATKELFLLGRRIDATRAVALGLVTESHPPDALEGEVLRAAGEIAALSPRALAANKRILERLRAEGRVLNPQLESELEALHDACFDSGELAEGIAAFVERRAPRWHS